MASLASGLIITQENYKRATWKNGSGHTDEIAIYPPGSDLKTGNFLWRISSARIEQASVFSIFPHHDRILVVIDGMGLRLIHKFDESSDEEEMINLGPFEHYEFPGDIPSRCELVDGPIRDLSVFIRKGQIEATAEAIPMNAPFQWLPTGKWNFAFAACGEFQIKSPFEEDFLTLRPGNTLQVELDEPLSEDRPYLFETSYADAALILISLASVS